MTRVSKARSAKSYWLEAGAIKRRTCCNRKWMGAKNCVTRKHGALSTRWRNDVRLNMQCAGWKRLWRHGGTWICTNVTILRDCSCTELPRSAKSTANIAGPLTKTKMLSSTWWVWMKMFTYDAYDLVGIKVCTPALNKQGGYLRVTALCMCLKA